MTQERDAQRCIACQYHRVMHCCNLIRAATTKRTALQQLLACRPASINRRQGCAAHS